MEQGNYRFESQLFQDCIDKTFYYRYVGNQYNETFTGRFISNTDEQAEHWIHESWKSQAGEVLLQTRGILEVEGGQMVITEEVVHTLSIEIGIRKVQRNEFTLTEVYEVLKACFDGIDALRNYGNHGNVTASSVFLTHSRRWKLGNFNSYILHTGTYQGYVHPYKLRREKVDKWAVDLHALGVLVLHMCMLQPPEAKPSAESYKVYNPIVDEIFEKLKSKALVLVFKGLLNVKRQKDEEENLGY